MPAFAGMTGLPASGMAAQKGCMSAERKSVTEAILSRKSVRAFLPRPVSRAAIEELLAVAARAPSGGNLQPWHVDIIAGEALDALKAELRAGFASSPGLGEMELTVYPSPLPEPYRSRRHISGEALYGAIGIPREDRTKRLAQFARNFEAFGAPVLLLFSIDRIGRIWECSFRT
jgi:nitroreductase